MNKHIHTITGAFGYSGKYIAHRLLEKGYEVETLTNSTDRENRFGNQIKVHPFDFQNPDQLVESLKNTKVLYNTYWVRFNHKTFTHSEAVKNTITLFQAAKKAGVEKIIHVSITNPDEHSYLEYFQGKGILEKALINLGVSYSILRPAVLFGKEDILINNIAWMLRKFPLFGVFGDGNYGIQPIYVDDLAELAVQEGENPENEIINAIGPETFTYKELVQIIGAIIQKPRKIISISPAIGFFFATLTGKFVNDTILTKEEIYGLMDGLLKVETPATGKTALTTWTNKHANTLGKNYTSELARRRDRSVAYASN
ncbi:MAG: nucleoside-diphosphate-sugar epimerase [bacterium]|jgi:nucleoside-diphosphate-sugar epimerase